MLTGLGSAQFESAVSAMLAIYTHFQTFLSGHTLRPWQPEQAQEYLAITIGNRYLTRTRDAAGEAHVDLGDVIDPFNILRPLLSNQVHVQENVVEYWERGAASNGQQYV